ncbi:MAG TPA: hypothetical protein VFT32_07800 [Candidatus Eisenbacteria bacterium]|nr:hypothetical protein [Candidatus Eisenbacteria bacterium]
MRIARLLPLALAAFLVGPAADASPEPAPQITAGDRIKVETTTPSRAHVGTFVALDDSTLSLRPGPERTAIEIPRSDIAALSVSTGHHSRFRKALYGLGIGAVSGFLLGYASGDDEHGAWDFIWFTAEEKGLIAGTYLGLAGGIVGLALHPGDRWSRVPIETLRVAPHVTSGGAPGMAVTLRF